MSRRVATLAKSPSRFRSDRENSHLEVIIDRQFALSDAAEAHAYIEQNSILGRVVLRP